MFCSSSCDRGMKQAGCARCLCLRVWERFICVGKKKKRRNCNSRRLLCEGLRLQDDSKKMIFPKPSLKLYANLWKLVRPRALTSYQRQPKGKTSLQAARKYNWFMFAVIECLVYGKRAEKVWVARISKSGNKQWFLFSFDTVWVLIWAYCPLTPYTSMKGNIAFQSKTFFSHYAVQPNEKMKHWEIKKHQRPHSISC